MAIDPRIPLMGQQPNFLATIGQANQMAAQQNEAQHQNAFRQFMQESGPGVFRGETAALEGLSRFDPNAAFSIKAQQERLQLARAAGARAAANARVTAEQKEKAARDYQMLRSVALARENGPEAFNQALATTGLAASGVTPENFDVYLATADGMAGELFGRIQDARPQPEYGVLDGQFYDKKNPGAGAQPIPNFKPEEKGPLVDMSNSNFGQGATDTFYDEVDKKNAQMFTSLASDSMGINTRVAQIDELERLLSNSSGGVGDRLKLAAGEYGINTEGLSDLQAAQAIINRLVPEQRPPGSGPMSDADLELFKQSLPRIINQPDGNKRILQTLRGIASYQRKQGEIAQKVITRELTPAEGVRALRELSNPLAGQRRPGETTIGGYTIIEVDP